MTYRWRCSVCNDPQQLERDEFPISCCGKIYEFPNGVIGKMRPSLARRVVNLAAAAKKHIATGMNVVDDVVRQYRLEQCLSCTEYYDPVEETCAHPLCGCGVKRKRGIIDKLSWASQDCPIGRWSSPPPVEVLSVYYKTKSDVSIGLGVNAQTTAGVLNLSGMRSESIAVSGVEELMGLLSTESPPKLVSIEGCWLAPDDMVALAAENYRTHFTMRCHSQLAFLQIEPDSIGRLHDVATYSKKYGNIKLSGNSRRFTDWADFAWDCKSWYLPNLYPTNNLTEPKPRGQGGAIKIGVFGRMRHQKHHCTSAGAAALIARELGMPVIMYVNKDDRTSGGGSIMSAVRQVVSGIPNLTLNELDWQSAADFRKKVADMDVCFQLSASETFNMVTADAAAFGVPTVVGEAIDWVPKDWIAPVDNPVAAAKVAIRLLRDPTAGRAAQLALLEHAARADEAWKLVLKECEDGPART